MFAPPPLPRTLEACLRDLGSDKPDVRASAIQDLVRHARGDDDVRADALARIGERLDDAHPGVRSAAAVALGDLEAKELVARLVAKVDDDDAHVRQMAINALGEIGDPEATARLRRALGDSRPEVRYQAIIAFARVSGDDDEIDRSLLRATNDDDDAIVHIALRIAEERIDAGKTPPEALRVRARVLMKSESAHVALVAAILLAKSGDEAGHDLLMRVVRGERIRGQDADKEDEQAAVELVGQLGLEAAVPYLERRAWGFSRWVKDTCAFHARIALARMKNPRAVKEILAELESGKKEVVSAAVVAAGRARIASAKPILERLPAAAADPELVKEALASLE